MAIKPAKPKRRIPWSSIGSGLNSAAGVALLGFILTSVLGVLITNWVKSVEETRQSNARVVAEERASLDRLRSVIDVTLSERAELIDEISYDVTRDSGEDDLEQAWPLYRKSVRDGNRNLWRAQYDLETVTGMDNDATSNLVFSNYLNIFVAEKLQLEDECLQEAHDSYLDKALAHDARVIDAKADLEGCQQPSWDQLRLCMRDLSLNLDEAIAHRIQVVEARKKSDAAEAEAGMQAFYNGTASAASSGNAGDPDTMGVVASLTQNCGPMPKEWS